MGAVVAAPMDRPKVREIIRAALPLLDEVVRGVGARLAAEMADALVADDHGGGELAPGLGTVVAIETISAHTLRSLPTRRAMDWWLPRQGDGPETTTPARLVCLRARVFKS